MSGQALRGTEHGNRPLALLRLAGAVLLITLACWAILASKGRLRLNVLRLPIAAFTLGLAGWAALQAERKKQQRPECRFSGDEDYYRRLTEHSRDIIIMGTLDGTRRYVSPAAEEILGWSPAEMLASSYIELAHPDDLPMIRDRLERLSHGEDVHSVTYRMRTRDGVYKWLEANPRPYLDPRTGKVVGFVTVVRDIQKRKDAETSLQNAYETLEALATVDGLTGVANRRRFDEAVGHEWRRALRAGSPLSLVLLDVDHFKLYNDFYGHVRGDSCLKQIAEAAQDVLSRPADLVARFGGEEFAIILPNTESTGAADIAEQLRQAVERRALPHEAHAPGVVTISAGHATLTPALGSKATMLIEAADHALYAAKHKGRNRVEPACVSLEGKPVAV